MDSELFGELAELVARWHDLAHNAHNLAQSNPNDMYDGYMLGLEIAADDLTRVMGKILREQRAVAEFDN
jgi:hypothetical protein